MIFIKWKRNDKQVKDQKNEIFKTLEEEYEFERRLANKLRNSSSNERAKLYRSVYDEFYSRESLYAKLSGFGSPETISKAIHTQIEFLRRFLRKDLIFLEVGPGNYSFAAEVAQFVKLVYTADVMSSKCDRVASLGTIQQIVFDGLIIPLKENSIHLIYSHQVIEHLHLDDAYEHFKNIYRVLVQGGFYICITPNRINGPHDISKYFASMASGLHLKEYTTSELFHAFRIAGFKKIKAYCGGKNTYISIPLFIIKFIEKFLDSLPHGLKKVAILSTPFRQLLGIRLVGTK